MSVLVALLLASAPVLEAELDSQTREDDELPPASVLRKAVAQLQKALATDPHAGWAYLILGSAHAKLGVNAAGTQAYETFLLSCRTYPNSDRVQRILTDDWRATGGKGSTVPRR